MRSGVIQAGALAGALLAIVGLLVVLGRAVRRVAAVWGQIREFLEDWRGEEARPGVPARLGVMTRLDRFERRLAKVELQVNPNGGGSLHDAVTAIKEVVVDQP